MFALSDIRKNVGIVLGIPGKTMAFLAAGVCCELEDWTGCTANFSSSWLRVPGLFAALEDALGKMASCTSSSFPLPVLC
jgi:hypothetical protein